MLAVIRNVTAQKQAEAALREYAGMATNGAGR